MLIIKPGYICVDFNDVKTVMGKMGLALMGIGVGRGENMAAQAVKQALSSPLFENIPLHGARAALINISAGPDLGIHEFEEALSIIQKEVADEADIILGMIIDEKMEGELRARRKVKKQMNGETSRRNLLKSMGVIASGSMLADAAWFVSSAFGSNKEGQAPIFTGFSDLDAIIDGFRPPELILLAGRPRTGRTTLAIDIAANASMKSGRSVLIFSLEHPKVKVAWEIIARTSGIGGGIVGNGPLSAEQIGLFLNNSNKFTDVSRWIDDTPAISLIDLWKAASEMKKQHSVELIVIDYL